MLFVEMHGLSDHIIMLHLRRGEEAGPARAAALAPRVDRVEAGLVGLVYVHEV